MGRTWTCRPAVVAAVLVAAVCTVSAAADVESAEYRSDLTLRHPAVDWVVSMDDSSLKYREPKSSADGSRVWAFAEDAAHGLGMTVYIEDTGGVAIDQAACRDYYWTALVKNPYPMTRVRFSEHGDFAVAEYVVLGYRDVRPSRMHVHGFLVRDGLCIGLNIAMTPHKIVNRPLADRVLESVRIVEPEEVQKSAERDEPTDAGESEERETGF
jgi:hypothetical protein